MNQPMRILVAYDGSSGADAVLTDLQRAGFSNDVEAIVLSVADVCMWPTSDPDANRTMPALASVEKAHRQALQAVEQARALATKASTRLRDCFPAGGYPLNPVATRQPGRSSKKPTNGRQIW